MVDIREEIDQLMISANELIQAGSVQEGLQKYQEAQEKAGKISWNERVSQINQLITGVLEKIEIQKQKDEKLKQLQRKKEQERQDWVSKQTQFQKEKENKLAERQKRMAFLQQQKQFEEQQSQEAYDLLEKGTQHIQSKNFEEGIMMYQKALSLFQKIKWVAEVERIKEQIVDAQNKYAQYEKSLEAQRNEAQKREDEAAYMQSRVEEAKIKQETQKQEAVEAKKILDEEESRKQAIAAEVFTRIDLVEKAIQDYEVLIDKIPFECPYPATIAIYQKNIEVLRNIGWDDQAFRLTDVIQTYMRKSKEDEKFRAQFKANQAKSKEDAATLKQRVALDDQIQEEKKAKELEKQNLEQAEQTRKQSIADNVFRALDILEKKIKEYEGYPDKVPYDSPYPSVITEYQAHINTLQGIGWFEQATGLKEAVEAYQAKQAADLEHRAKEKTRKAKTKEEAAMLEQRAALAQQILDEKKAKEAEKRQQEQAEQAKKQAIADNIFEEIEKLESEIREYESQPDKVPFECPYPVTITNYKEHIATLQGIGWFEQAAGLKDAVEAYQAKQAADLEYRARQKTRKAKTKEEAAMLEQRAALAQQIQDEKKAKEAEKRQQEQAEQAKKQAIADNVYAQIDLLEQQIREYEGQPNKIPLESPYPSTIIQYQAHIATLFRIGWNEQARSLEEAVEAYRDKQTTDQKNRAAEKGRKVKTQEEAEILEQQADLAKQIQAEAKAKEEEKRQLEQAEQAKKQAIADNVYAQIDSLEQEIREYEGQPDKIPFESPYPAIIVQYQAHIAILFRIGWNEQARALEEAVEAYRNKQAADLKYRASEKLRVAKTKEEIAMVEQRATLSKQIQEENKAKEVEKRQAEQVEQTRKQAIADEVYARIDKIEQEIREYEGQPDKIPFECPYPAAITEYQSHVTTLTGIGWMEQSYRLKEAVDTYKVKLAADQKYRANEKIQQAKTKEEAEMLEKRATIAQQLLDETKTKEAEKRQAEQAEQAKKQAIADEVYARIDKIEQEIRDYEGSGDKIPFECPYPAAIAEYQTHITTLTNIGWMEQSYRLKEALEAYRAKLDADQKYRAKEKTRVAKTKEEAEMLEQRAALAQQLIEEKVRKVEEKRREEQKELARKQIIADQVYSKIKKIEQIINEYKEYPDKIPYDCPYEDAIDYYKDGAEILKEIGWIEQSNLLSEGMHEYQVKLEQDIKYRLKEEQRVAKTKEEKELLVKRAEIAKELEFEKNQRNEDKQREEQEDLARKQNIANDAFQRINVQELRIKEYESLVDKVPYDCPYGLAIDEYRECAQILREILWTEQAALISEGMKGYQVKLEQDIKYRLKEKQRVAKTQEEADVLEKRAALAKQIQEEKYQKEKEKRERDQIEQTRKQRIASEVYQKVDQIQKIVKTYEEQLDKVPFECPYADAIEIYKDGTQIFKEIGWIEEVTRFTEGMKTYQAKSEQDNLYREKEKLRIAKTKEEAEMLDQRATLSRQMIEEKARSDEEKRRAVQEEQARKQRIANEAYQRIKNVEASINDYENQIDKIPYECPFEEAIKIYKNSAQILQELGFIENAALLLGGMRTYEVKLKQDKIYRESEKQRVAKTKEEKKLLKQRAALAKELEEKRKQQKIASEQAEQAEQANKQAIADKIFEKINFIEQFVKEYEGKPDRVPYQCPYKEAIEIYSEGIDILQNLSWFEEANRISDGMRAYQIKLENDINYRKREALRVAKNKEEETMLEQRAALAKKLKDEKEQLEAEKRNQDLAEDARKKQEGEKAFRLMDEGNLEAKQFNYNKAIEKYQDAFDILKSINWTIEADETSNQIRIFEQERLFKERELQREAEQKQKQRETMERIERMAEISHQLQRKKKLEKDEKKQLQSEQNQLEAEQETQRLVEESQKLETQKAHDRQLVLQQEMEKDQREQKIYDECLELLGQARQIANDHDLTNSLKIYKEVKEIYASIGYTAGVQLTEETIQKVKEDHAYYQQQQRAKRNSLEEQVAEQQRLLQLIQETQEESERKKLKQQQQLLADQIQREKNLETQNQIITLMEEASNLTLDHQYDLAIEKYSATNPLFESIEWPLKYRQVQDIVKELRIQKKSYREKQKNLVQHQEEEEKAQKAFEELMAHQEAKRKEQEEQEEQLEAEKTAQTEREKQLGKDAFTFLDLAEQAVSGEKIYMGLHYFHFAFQNFTHIGWKREAKTTQKRFDHIFSNVVNPIVDKIELLQNQDLTGEYTLIKDISLSKKAQQRKNFERAINACQNALKTVKELKWERSLTRLDQFLIQLNQEFQIYQTEQELKKRLPSEEKAIRLFYRATIELAQQHYDDAMEIGQKAVNMYRDLGIEKEARKMEQELYRWKLRHEKDAELLKAKDKEENIEGLSEEERQRVILEERRKKRREQRKKKTK